MGWLLYCDACGEQIKKDQPKISAIVDPDDDDGDTKTYHFHKNCVMDFAEYFQRDDEG